MHIVYFNCIYNIAHHWHILWLIFGIVKNIQAESCGEPKTIINSEIELKFDLNDEIPNRIYFMNEKGRENYIKIQKNNPEIIDLEILY